MTRAHSFVTIGVFDGVHRGHLALLEPLVAEAREAGALPAVVTFEPHPARVVAPDHEPRLLTPGPEKLRLLMEAGIERVLLVRFDRAFSLLSAREFLERRLLVHFPRLKLLLGHDQRFGRGREAGIDEIRALAADLGFEVVVAPPLRVDGAVVSSTRIRHAVEQADLESAARALGRPFALAGRVVRGAARGARLGFPTANLQVPSEQLLPPRGVYASWGEADGVRHPAVANIGVRPTFGEDRLTIEAHLLGFSGDLIGRRFVLEPVERLREERKFNDINELISAVRADIEAARRRLGPSSEGPSGAREATK